MTHAMKEQWDRIGAENAFFGVLSLSDYEDVDKIDIERFWESGRDSVDAFLKLLNFDNPKASRMVEIGCGLGRMTHQFSRHFGSVCAVDVSQEMLRQAQSHWGHLQNVEWVLGNGDDLQPIASESVDFVFSFLVLQHIPDPKSVIRYIRETERVLKQGGVALLQFRVMPAQAGLTGIKYGIFKYCPHAMTKTLMWCWDALHGNLGVRAKFAREYEAWRGCALSATSIETAAAEAGLKILRTERLGKQSPGTESRYYIFGKVGSGAKGSN